MASAQIRTSRTAPVTLTPDHGMTTAEIRQTLIEARADFQRRFVAARKASESVDEEAIRKEVFKLFPPLETLSKAQNYGSVITQLLSSAWTLERNISLHKAFLLREKIDAGEISTKEADSLYILSHTSGVDVDMDNLEPTLQTVREAIAKAEAKSDA